jgi:hypothetical protein
VADDWRPARNERQTEADALGVILGELRDNGRALTTYREQLGQQVRTTDDFLAAPGTGSPADTLSRPFRQANDSWNYQPPGPAFEGVVQSGQLALIEDAELTRLHPLLLQRPPGVSGGTQGGDRGGRGPDWAPASAAHALRADRRRELGPRGDVEPLRMGADQEFLASVGEGRMSRAYLRRRLDEVFLPANTRLVEKIEAYLAGR